MLLPQKQASVFLFLFLKDCFGHSASACQLISCDIILLRKTTPPKQQHQRQQTTTYLHGSNMIASLIRLVVALCCIATGYPATADTHMYSRSKYDSLYIVHHGCVCVFSVLIFCQSRSRHVAEYSFAFLHET